ncbi:hypothetical protein RclHR1_00920003 [Rhizophagus clarus]|uniref:Uncharacterized protein n=1 Tax=Rhizophagus clarus TaxID=94130 RepID=A0A2Z6SDX9_9GLOM|nr:hypothetical protein RclHR1_00920003 [Rhizophagus clarus]GES73798.1 hypothetical protein GLOIN_2v1781937 [Rhizophagus clarus]
MTDLSLNPSSNPTSRDDDNFNTLSNVSTIEENVPHTTIQRHDDRININQENVIVSEYSFFYRPCNDFQIYHITCKEKTSDELIFQLLNNCLYSSHYLYTDDIFVFYFQQPNDKRIYQITCEMVPHSLIVQYLNLNIYGIELKQNEQQQQQQFSDRHKENLEFHLKQFLFDYLAPKEDNLIDENMNNSVTNDLQND